ncbi:undecaprenyl diphosphate synthase family protein, partial [Escherichia coli]
IDLGHAYADGARKAVEVLRWCDDLGVRAVTLWLLSLANFERATDQLRPLFATIAHGTGALAATGRWRIRPVGHLDRLPP